MLLLLASGALKGEVLQAGIMAPVKRTFWCWGADKSIPQVQGIFYDIIGFHPEYPSELTLVWEGRSYRENADEGITQNYVVKVPEAGVYVGAPGQPRIEFHGEKLSLLLEREGRVEESLAVDSLDPSSSSVGTVSDGREIYVVEHRLQFQAKASGEILSSAGKKIAISSKIYDCELVENWRSQGRSRQRRNKPEPGEI